jgi:hypothetical protein
LVVALPTLEDGAVALACAAGPLDVAARPLEGEDAAFEGEDAADALGAVGGISEAPRPATASAGAVPCFAHAAPTPTSAQTASHFA